MNGRNSRPGIFGIHDSMAHHETFNLWMNESWTSPERFVASQFHISVDASIVSVYVLKLSVRVETPKITRGGAVNQRAEAQRTQEAKRET